MFRFGAVLAISAAPAVAQDLNVVTDIAPVRALVAGLMQDAGQVDAVLPPGASPHDFAMRPSDAGRLADADLVVWVGEGLTPWLGRPIQTLAQGAQVLALLDTPGWEQREVGAAEHDHGHDGHDHGPIDPHGWLDPIVAVAWTAAIGEALAAAQGTDAEAIKAAVAAQTENLQSLATSLAPRLRDVGPYVLPHDGYGYFEARFGLDHVAVVTDSDDVAAGPGHLAKLRAQVVAGEVACVFHEVGPVPGWVDTLVDGTDVKVLTLDPLGVDVPMGPDFYPALITGLADSFAQCSAGASGS